MQLVRAARGFTLLELLIAAVVFVIVSLAVGTFYIATIRALEDTTAQAFVQRQGSRVQDYVSDHLFAAVEVQGSGCQPAGMTPSASLVFQKLLTTRLHPCRFCCLYQVRDTELGDEFPQLYLCSLGTGTPVTLGASTDCTGNRQNLLQGAGDVVALRACDASTAGCAGFPGPTFSLATSVIQPVAPGVVVTFALTDGKMPRPQVFAVTVRARN